MARINDFRSKLIGGGARGSQFQVLLTFPSSIVTASASVADSGRFMCTAASLPASTIIPIEVPFRGRFIKIAGERTFQNWSITIMNDTDFTLRKVMEEWSSAILNHGSTAGVVNPSAYVTNMQVQQLSRSETYNAEEKVIRTYKFYNCYPINVSDIGLDFADTNRIQQFNVEFSVDYWTADNIV